jgi:hypothetical protein
MTSARLFNGNTPITPPAGSTTVYVDQFDKHLKQIDDTGTIIDLTETGGAPVDSNVVIVTKESDFPAPTGGFIELDPNIRWDIQNADVVVTNPFKCLGPTSIVGRPSSSKLSYLGSGDLFTSIDAGDLDIGGLTLNFPNADMLNMRGDTLPVTAFFRFENCTCIGGKSFGVYKDLIGISFFSIVAGLFSPTARFDSGLTDIGTLTSFVTIAKMGYYSENPGFIGFDFGSNAYDSLEVANTRFTAPAGSFALSGLANSGNLKTGEIGSIFSCEVTGGCAPLQTIEEDGFRWSFFEFPPVPNSSQESLYSLTGNTTITTMAQNTPTPIAGTWVEEVCKQFTCSPGALVTALFERDIVIKVNSILSIEAVSGTNKTLSAYLVLNGSVITNSKVSIQVDAGSPQQLSLLWSVAISNGDTLQVYIENESDSNGALVSNGSISYAN